MRKLVGGLLILSLCGGVAQARLNIINDEFTGKKTIETEPVRMVFDFSKLRSPVVLSIYYKVLEVDGQEVPVMSLMGFFGDWKFMNDSTLYLLIDGAREAMDMGHKGDVLSGGNVAEYAYKVVTPDFLQKLVAAKEVRGRIAGVEFQFNPACFEATREFLSVISPDPQPTTTAQEGTP